MGSFCEHHFAQYVFKKFQRTALYLYRAFHKYIHIFKGVKCFVKPFFRLANRAEKEPIEAFFGKEKPAADAAGKMNALISESHSNRVETDQPSSSIPTVFGFAHFDMCQTSQKTLQ